MRKRERENPCGICGHYHKYEEGEVCGVCGHRPPAASPAGARQQDSAFPSEILKEFLFLGCYDNASCSELLKTIGVLHILNGAKESEGDETRGKLSPPAHAPARLLDLPR